MKKYFALCFAFIAIVFQAHAQGTIAFYTALPQFGGTPILYLSDNYLFGNLGTSDLWNVSVRFPASSTETATDFQVLGPIVSVYPPQDDIPGGQSITYTADFSLTDSQRLSLLAGNAQLVLVQNLFSSDPTFQPQTFQGLLVAVPEPPTWALFMAGILEFGFWKQLKSVC